MTEIVVLGNITLSLAYVALCATYVVLFLRDDAIATRLATPLLLGTIAAHAANMSLYGLEQGRLPMATSAEFFSLLALTLTGLYAMLERVQRVRATGFMPITLAMLFQLPAGAFIGHLEANNPLLRDPGFAVHVSLVIIAYTALALGFLYAILYLVQARQLSQRRFGLLFRRLPPLATLERMTTRSVQIGVPVLFLALLAGQIWLYSLSSRVDADLAARLSPADPKILTAWATFWIYTIGLIGNRFFRWRGRRLSYFFISAFLLMLIGTSITRATLPSFHHFHHGLGL